MAGPVTGWQEQANCRGLSPDLFFPERGDTAGVRAALRVCAGCRVREDCLAAHPLERDGIWGGTTARDRRRLRRVGARRTNWPDAVVAAARDLFDAGHSTAEAASRLRVPYQTIRTWREGARSAV